jgi:hypothetical protein
MDEEADSMLLAFLYEDIDDFKRTILIPILIGTDKYQAAQAQLNALNFAANDVEMTTFYAYYSLLNTAYLNSTTELNFDSTQIALLYTIANTSTPSAAKAKALLTQHYVANFNEIYYEWAGELNKTTGLAKSQQHNKVEMYPNPASTQLLITSETTINEYSIYDMSGRNLLTQSADAVEVKLNTLNLQNGIYFIHLTYTDGSTSKHKIVIQH